MSLDSSVQTAPLYSRVETVLAADISTGALSPGSQIPTEDNLIARFDVSRTTVRKAIQNLAGRGLVEIRRGKGTFVTQPKITQELTELSGFVEDMLALGRNPTARLIDKRAVAATETVARKLELTTGTLVMRIQRVRLADGVAISFDESFLPLELGEKIVTNDLEAEPIFSLLEQKYKIPLVEAEYRLEAVSAEPVVSAVLGIGAGSPIFLIERTSYSAGNQPVDYEKLHYRGDLVRFVTRLSRNPANNTDEAHKEISSEY
jgi:GntR family transcriptional regulator